MKYISHGTAYNTIDRHVPAPLFKRVFDCEEPTGTTLVITAVGLYRLFCNGRELTRSLFAPYMSNPDQVVFSDTYLLDGYLKKTGNVLCVLLGNGFANCNDYNIWGNDTAPYRSAPKFALCIRGRDGHAFLETDETFGVADSPITFDDFRCGEHYDARREIAGVLTSQSLDGFESADIASAPRGEILPSVTQPVTAHGERRAVSVTKTARGHLYDFGVNDTGIYRLTLDAHAGQTVDMTFGEVLEGEKLDLRNISFAVTKEGYIQHDRYICREGQQTYRPSFAWHGFRYCEVIGLTDAQATPDALVVIPTHTDMAQVCRFVCDNDTVNRLAELTLRSDLSNFVYYPYDCPHREKNGWTADASLSAEQMLWTFDALPSFRQWLHMVRRAQRDDGALPGIVPTAGWGFDWGNGPAWDSALVEVPYQLYRFLGDTSIVTENAGAIRKYFAYITGWLNGDGLVSIGLGDWCQTYTRWEGDFETPVEVTDSLTMIDLARKTAEMFEKVSLDASDIRRFGEELTGSFREKYLRDGRLTVQTQTALAMAVHLGVLTSEEEKTAFNDLLALIHGQGDHFRVGVVGYKHLFEILAERGEAELCFRLITQKSFPSYGYWLEQGATTLWESFEEYDRDGEKLVRRDGVPRIPSFNHHFWGGVLAWFYRYIGWLQVVSAHEVRITPTSLGEVTGAKIHYARGNGSVTVEWHRTGDRADLTVTVHGFRAVLKYDGETLLDEGENRFVINMKRSRESWRKAD